MQTCISFRVSGRVQGVFFRASTREKALELGLDGWVANRADGDVEGVACGDERQLALFQAWLGSGPPMARVSKLDCKDYQGRPCSGFEIR